MKVLTHSQSPRSLPPTFRHSGRMRNGLIALFGCLAILLFSACATMRQPEVTVPDIISMSQAGIPAEEIINRMRESGTVYQLEASQYADLKNKGVPDSVLNYMQQTYIEAIQRNRQLAEMNYWRPYNDYRYGAPPLGWQGIYPPPAPFPGTYPNSYLYPYNYPYHRP